MKILRNTVIRAGLEALYFSGAHYLLRPIFAGVGAIFMLHHVRPSHDAEFQPNHHLEVDPEFLRAMLAHLRTLDIDIVTIDEAHARLSQRNFARRFACFYVASDFAAGTGRLWWVALERVIAKASAIEAPIGGMVTRFDTSTAAAKQATFDRLHDWLRGLPSEHDVEREISALCTRYDVDETTIARDLCMSWDELKAFADDSLVTIGAHTITHCNLAKQSEATATFEMVTGRIRIEAALQRPVHHLAYPYGDRIAAGTREFTLAGRPVSRPR
jgi:peptidoglycan/xylan/chitin deacetylase (PgdA/CDA1 family)